MTPKSLRLLAIALSLFAVNASRSQGEETHNVVSAKWVPPPQQSNELPPVFLEPIPVDSAFPSAEAVPPLPAEPIIPNEPIVPDQSLDSPAIVIDGNDEDEEEDEDLFGRPYNAPGWYSHPEWHNLDWRSGAGGRFGEFSFAGTSAQPITVTTEEDRITDALSFTSGHAFRWLDGPSQSDMPPRLFEFHWGLHYFGELNEGAWIDLGFSAGIYTDFEDSVREGWRVPAHAVFSWEIVPEVQPVIGVKYYDRDNLGLLPVAGLILRPDDEMRIELVFPEPKIAWQISESEEKDHWLSFSGRIGGGEWAIERRPSGLADVVSYNDYQLVLGIETIDQLNEINSLEIGYSFERELDYRSGVGNFEPSETIFVRLVTRR